MHCLPIDHRLRDIVPSLAQKTAGFKVTIVRTTGLAIGPTRISPDAHSMIVARCMWMYNNAV
jgi:hypothetical protein